MRFLMSFQEIKNYLKVLRPYISFSAAIFFLSVLSGFVSVIFYPFLFTFFLDRLSQFAGSIENFDSWGIFLVIFLNNGLKALFSVLLGVAFAVYPVLLLLANGFVIGVLLSGSIDFLDVFLLSIIPHGIIEIPVIFLGTSIGIMLGLFLYRNLFRRENNPIKESFLDGLRFLFTLILPLLLLAAFIEVTVTPMILEIYSS